jgi:hypothetical protein
MTTKAEKRERYIEMVRRQGSQKTLWEEQPVKPMPEDWHCEIVITSKKGDYLVVAKPRTGEGESQRYRFKFPHSADKAIRILTGIKEIKAAKIGKPYPETLYVEKIVE